MALVSQTYGCKVGWETYDVKAEALSASKRARADAGRQASRGYDFGYCVPGAVTHVPHHRDFGCAVWVVTIP